MNVTHMTQNKSVRGWVAGRVQGVSYRASFEREARRLALTGWVRNLADGRVEFSVSGPQQSVDTLLEWARIGPKWARVDDWGVADLEETPQSTFEIRY